MAKENKHFYEFGPYRLDPERRVLLRSGEPVPLTSKAFETLLVLVQHQEQVVSKDELMKRLWPDTFVEESNLTQHVSLLRKALGESPQDHRYIVTLPGRGYRFAERVRETSEDGEELVLERHYRQTVTVEEPGAESSRYIEAFARRGYRFIGTPERMAATDESKQEIRPAAIEPATQHPIRRNWALGIGVAAAVAALLIIFAAANFGKLRDRLSGRTSPQKIQSLAVLPLTNLSGDPAQDYFTDGLTDALIGDLSQVSELKVISRTSSMQYKQTKKSLPDIARELGVDGVIEGTVQRSGDRVRVTAQLIQGATDKNIWSGSYDRNQSDALTLQGDIARTIAQEIRVQLTPKERQRMTHTPEINLPAMEDYLQGQYHYQKAKDMGFRRGMERQHQAELDTAIGFYQRAVAEDPHYARAYLGMGEIWGVPATFPYPPYAMQQPAREAIAKALAIDPDMAEAYVALARMDLRAWRWEALEQEARHAIELNSNLASARKIYWSYLAAVGRMDEAREQAEREQALDPGTDAVAWIYYGERKFDRFIELKRNDIIRHAYGPMAHYDLGYGYWLAHMYKEAVDEWEEAMTGFGYDELAEDLRRGYAANGFKGAIREWAAGWERNSTGEGLPPDHLAYLYSMIGEQDRAFVLLEKAVETHSSGPAYFKADPTYDNLRTDPRFDQLMRRVGLLK